MDLTSLGVILEVSRRKKVLSGLFLFIMTNMVYFIGIYVTVSRGRPVRCLRCLLLVMCTHPFAEEALTLHLARSEGHERYFGTCQRL